MKAKRMTNVDIAVEKSLPGETEKVSRRCPGETV